MFCMDNNAKGNTRQILLSKICTRQTRIGFGSSDERIAIFLFTLQLLHIFLVAIVHTMLTLLFMVANDCLVCSIHVAKRHTKYRRILII